MTKLLSGGGKGQGFLKVAPHPEHFEMFPLICVRKQGLFDSGTSSFGGNGDPGGTGFNRFC